MQFISVNHMTNLFTQVLNFYVIFLKKLMNLIIITLDFGKIILLRNLKTNAKIRRLKLIASAKPLALRDK